MQPTAVVVNAGLGELSLGLTLSSFKVVAAYEADKKARAIHKMNIEVPIYPFSLKKIDAKAVPTADLLAAHLHLPRYSAKTSEKNSKIEALAENFRVIINHCNPKALLLFPNAAFLKSENLQALMRIICGDRYYFVWKVLDVSQITGLPVKESMICMVGLDQTIGRSFEFPERNYSFQDCLRLSKQPVDPWYYQITLNDVSKPEEGTSPFLCWKKDRYQDAEQIQWNFMKIPLVRDNGKIRKITHREIADLKGLPADFILPNTDRQWLYQKLIYSSNMLVVKQIGGAINYILNDNPWRSQQIKQALQFEKLFGRYLSNLAKMRTDFSLADEFVDNAPDSCADFVVRYRAETLFFTTKRYKSDFSIQSNVKKVCMHLAALNLPGTIILVVANEVSRSQKKVCLEDFGVCIWDVSNLLWIFDYFPDIKTQFVASLDFSIEHIEPTPPIPTITPDETEKKSEKSPWKEKLLSTEPGRENFSQYENVCTEILKYVLGDYLTLWATQEKSDEGLYRFDLCCKIKSGISHDFFDTVKHYFKTKYIVFEFKNYTKKITQKEIYTTEKYLYEKALRKVAIIISRSGADEHALQAAKGSLRENGKLILCLSDNSLIELIDIKERQEQEPADFLEALLDDLLVHLEK